MNETNPAAPPVSGSVGLGRHLAKKASPMPPPAVSCLRKPKHNKQLNRITNKTLYAVPDASPGCLPQGEVIVLSGTQGNSSRTVPRALQVLQSPDIASMRPMHLTETSGDRLSHGLRSAWVAILVLSPLAFLAAIFTTTALAWVLGYARPPDQFVSAPDFSTTFLALDIRGALKLALLPTVVAIFFTDLFDSLSTFIGVSAAAGLTGADGRPINLRRGLIVDAIATLGSGLAGTSPATAYVESIAGIRMGGRTGRASVVTALCFVPCFFLGPLAAAIPPYATASVLILVGVSMFHAVSTIDFSSLEDSLPAFVTVALIPLTLSITQGILWGFLLHGLLYVGVGRWREISPTLGLLSALSAGLLLLAH